MLAMPGMECAELVDGVIKEWAVPGAEHGLIESDIAFELKLFSKEQKPGWVMTGEAGVYIRRFPDTVRKFDAAFLSRELHPNRPGAKYLDVAPEVIVEVMSPTDRWNQDFRDKIADYFSAGVEEVWVVEPKLKQIRQYDSAETYQTITDTLHGNGVLSGFVLDVTALFADE